LESARQACAVDDAAAESLASPRRPVVLLPGGRHLARSVAPGLIEVGAMLPSPPLHELLLREFGGAPVMTSGNLSEEPIAAENDEARARLGEIADAFLLHDRPIASRYDDSVVRVVAGAEMVTRRARGDAPAPLALSFQARRPILAFGAHLKSTFCLVKDRHAFVSQHVGDLESVETLRHYTALLRLYEELFAIRPAVVAHDLHPGYLSTKLALERDCEERVAVQHHHAHVVSCLAEHGIADPSIGVAYDGLGYGADGALWGGEVLVADWRDFTRRAHFREAPMPGGEAAVRRPYRMALGYLHAWFPSTLDAFAPFVAALPEREVAAVAAQVERGLNAPRTSSCGRLFDAVAAILGIRGVAQYEGQAAMELQARADPSAEGRYPFEIEDDGDCWIIDPSPTIWAVNRERAAGVPTATIAMRFHRTVAAITVEVCRRIGRETGLKQVALGGGVFQNH